MCSYQSMLADPLIAQAMALCYNIWLIMHSCMMFLHCLVFKEHLRSFMSCSHVSKRLLYLTSSNPFCQELFHFLFEVFFRGPSPAPCTPLPLCPVRWRLVYNTQIRGRCQHLFSIFFFLLSNSTRNICSMNYARLYRRDLRKFAAPPHPPPKIILFLTSS